MTTAEAIEEINERIEIINERIEIIGRDYADDIREYLEVLKMAIEALRKQEPVKPTYDHRYGELGCSFCGNLVSGWEEGPNYCPNCGQKIDWSEE